MTDPRTLNALYEANPTLEADDYVIGFMMVSEISGAVPELKANYLAHWAARLRERYIEIGRQLEYDKLRNP